VHSEIDLRRLAELQELLGTELPAIVETLVAELDSSMEAIAAGLGQRDLGAVALAAHSARNSALIIDSKLLLAPLGELESCARRSDLPSALTFHERLVEVWPPLRVQLERVAAGEQ
jgi:hypothetical protein